MWSSRLQPPGSTDGGICSVPASKQDSGWGFGRDHTLRLVWDATDTALEELLLRCDELLYSQRHLQEMAFFSALLGVWGECQVKISMQCF